jgi:hypothetical protein
MLVVLAVVDLVAAASEHVRQVLNLCGNRVLRYAFLSHES